MASFAPVNHPPFAYDPSSQPTKSILKQKSRLSRSSSSWFSNINSKFSSASMNFTTESNIPSLVTNNNSQQQVQAQEPVPARSIGLLNLKKFINNNTNGSDTSSIISNNSSLLQDYNNNNNSNNNNNNSNGGALEGDELAADELKRVRFSVKKLTTEYYPYRNTTPLQQQTHDNAGEEDEEQPSPSSSIDAPELPENAAALLLSDNTEPQEDDAKLEKTALCDDDEYKKKTPLELYEIACRNKEELPFPGFVTNLSQVKKNNKTKTYCNTFQRVLTCGLLIIFIA